MSLVPEMSIVDTTKTFNQTVQCETVVKMYFDMKRDHRRVESIGYNFDVNRMSDRVHCQNPNKSVSVSKEELNVVFDRCNACSLCVPTIMKNLS